MSSQPITSLSALALAAELHAGRLTITAVLDAYFAAIDALDAELNCYITLTKELAYARAAEIQPRLDAGDIRSPLAGVPVAVKDLICTEGVATTCASKMLRGFKPPYSATAVERLWAADMILLGKTNLDAFAMGSTGETSAFGPTKNPRNPAHVPGGSSSGSAAAVAAGLAPIALGTDTGGSIRQPAAYCGIVGLKPTYGAVSRYGAVGYASSLDQIGPMARDTADCAALFEIIKGDDPRDCICVAHPNTPALPLKGLRVGLPTEYFGEGLQPEVAAAVFAARDALIAQGAVAVELSLPMAKYAIPTYYVVTSAEASSNLARFDGISYGHCTEEAESLLDTYVLSRSEAFGLEIKRRIMLGNFVLSAGYFDAYYKKALQAKTLIRRGFDAAFEQCDVILGPVAPTTAPRLGESLSDPLKMYLGDIYTAMVNLAGLPALAVPFGSDEAALPIGVQLIGRTFEEATLFGCGARLR